MAVAATSMLRTMELILGLPPLTEFDANAAPMLDAFAAHPDLPPYKAVQPAQNMQEVTR